MICISFSAEATFPKTIVFGSIGSLIFLLIIIPLCIKRWLGYRSKKAEQIMVAKDSEYQWKLRYNRESSSNEKGFSEHLNISKEQSLYWWHCVLIECDLLTNLSTVKVITLQEKCPHNLILHFLESKFLINKRLSVIWV